ncbi:MAG: GNAT family N-acetyltransferase [Pirellulales bacterium]|nr:GNAT family N-acetyltransferase [Pirellulales bacterium]
MACVMQMEEISPEAVEHGQLLAAAELLCRVWPKPGRTPESRVEAALSELRAYDGPHNQRPRSFLLREQGKAIAHASIVSREIILGSERVVVAGLARVCTAPEQRGRGLGELVVRAAFETIDRDDFPWALFQTNTSVRPFYERLGSALVENRIVNSRGDDSEANPFWDEVVMRYPNRPDWPAGTIDLLGPGY